MKQKIFLFVFLFFLNFGFRYFFSSQIESLRRLQDEVKDAEEILKDRIKKLEESKRIAERRREISRRYFALSKNFRRMNKSDIDFFVLDLERDERLKKGGIKITKRSEYQVSEGKYILNILSLDVDWNFDERWPEAILNFDWPIKSINLPYTVDYVSFREGKNGVSVYGRGRIFIIPFD